MTPPRQPPPLTVAEATTSTIHAGEDADTTTEPSTSTSPDIREAVGFASFGRHCGTKPDLGDDIPQPESRDLHAQTVVTPRAHDLPRSSLLDVSDDTTRELPTSRFSDTCLRRRRTGCLHAISCCGVGWQGMRYLLLSGSSRKTAWNALSPLTTIAPGLPRLSTSCSLTGSRPLHTYSRHRYSQSLSRFRPGCSLLPRSGHCRNVIRSQYHSG
ncbi:hypothetical protein DFJ58DRAFT_821442 [Suillus subalutaceus]|uniref:uncharacterized protein n=1 Tax=Suillus subalutaceus TaxID=48586 RepID=UPI001B8612B5|nr:uncharacterized protein DFJ58DRAFT_821442 [Suillus subalutaceus]KAG1834360.1 hypothetical protein DFJ58DRAFT_821442 [Suillus subalutaceus]